MVLSELLNQRPPAAWVSVSPDGPDEGGALLQLARDCAALGTVLSLQGPTFDLLLIPRTAGGEDGVAFAAFATRVRIRAGRAAVVRRAVGGQPHTAP